MDNLDLIKNLGDEKLISAFVLAIVHYLRQIKLSFKHFENTMDSVRGSVSDLNKTMTRLIVERENDKEKIDRIRLDLDKLEENFHGKN